MFIPVLLPRDKFRSNVLKRDGFKCIFCDNSADTVHHILERRLWSDGGYYVDNGASVCEQHHIECEMTIRSVEEVREAAGIQRKVVPEHLYDDVVYDKWGNVILPTGQRMKGELFSDDSVQKILEQGRVLDIFVKYYKYPRTYHLPWSPGINDDDKVISDINIFRDHEVVITEKMDGENCAMYADYIHARSIDGRAHWSRDWVKNFHSKICWEIPEGFRICGENLYAKHSIAYNALDTYFYGFGVWNEDTCLSWDETIEYLTLLGINPVRVLYRGPFSMSEIARVQKTINFTMTEGYVMRKTHSFKLNQFKVNVGKYVRANHVQTKNHWMYDRIETNKLVVI